MNREVSRSIAKSGSFVIRSDSLHPENEFETVPMRTAEDESNEEDLDIRPHYAFMGGVRGKYAKRFAGSCAADVLAEVGRSPMKDEMFAELVESVREGGAILRGDAAPSRVFSTCISRRVNASRASVYRALLDPRAVATWMVPSGMTSRVYAFDARAGGSFRISLTYDQPTGTGKTTAHTDTYHGRFVELVPNERVVEVVEFETADPALRGEMTIRISLAEADGGTEVLAVHDRLPPGLSAADNEVGWREALAKLAALVEAGC